jgi:hypothetical protein
LSYDKENHQHKHKSKPHTQEKSLDPAIFIEDVMTNTVTVKLRSHVYVPEETTEFYAHEAGRCH